MGFFSKKTTVEELRGYKKITINGMRFTIKKINPLLDFHSDQMPQIFTDFVSARPSALPTMTPETIKKYQEDMYSIIRAGLVDPVLSKEGITAEDLFRDMEVGSKLYQEILEHSMNRFKGLKKLFFSIKSKYNSYITWRKLIGNYQVMLYMHQKNFQHLNNNSSTFSS
jgi:hypothetical protein